MSPTQTTENAVHTMNLVRKLRAAEADALYWKTLAQDRLRKLNALYAATTVALVKRRPIDDDLEPHEVQDWLL